MSVSLSKISPGKTVVIDCIECRRCLKKRLCSLGLYDGSIATVIKNDFHGPLLVKILNSKIIIGRSQAEKIFVKETA